MNTNLLVVLAGCLLPALGPAAAAEAPALSDHVISDDNYPERKVAFPGGVTGLPDLTYETLSGYRPMKLDLYLPPASFAGPRPFVIYIHGGGWANGIPRTAAVFANWPDVLASFAARGYVTASVSYRFQNEAPFPAAIQDVKAAIRWLHSNAENYNIDTTRGMTWGSSAGGQLAALAAVSCGVAALDPPVTAAGAAPANANVEKNTAGPLDAAASNCVQGAVGWYGVYDFETLGKGVAPGSPPLHLPSRYLDCGSEPCTAEKLRFASPVAYVDEKAPPILLIQGTDDHTVSPAQSPEFYEALRAKGAKVELMMLPGIDHSYIGATPEATREAALTGWLRRSSSSTPRSATRGSVAANYGLMARGSIPETGVSRLTR